MHGANLLALSNMCPAYILTIDGQREIYAAVRYRSRPAEEKAMSSKVERSDPQLWERVKRDLTRSDKGGKPDQWSARKAQLAVQEYKRRGGGYRGRKPTDTSLEQWTEEEWGTKSGRKSLESGERYLPKRARATG
jgi:hypothetical protein